MPLPRGHSFLPLFSHSSAQKHRECLLLLQGKAMRPRQGSQAGKYAIYGKLVGIIENVSMAERPTCRRSRHQESRFVCPAQLQAVPIPSLLHHSGGSFGAKIMLGCSQMRCAHGCDVLMGAMCSWICLSPTHACRPGKILSCPSPVPHCVICSSRHLQALPGHFLRSRRCIKDVYRAAERSGGCRCG